MKLEIASAVALLLLFAAQTPASAASAQAVAQAPHPTANQGLVEKTHWRGATGASMAIALGDTTATDTILRSTASTIGHTPIGVWAGGTGTGVTGKCPANPDSGRPDIGRPRCVF